MHSRSRKTTIDTNSIHKCMTSRGFKYCYLLTIAKHQVKDYVTVEDLQNIHMHLKRRLTDLYVPLVTFELSSMYKQLHLHGIALTKRAVFYQKHNSIAGFRVQWKKVYNIKGAIGYVLKDSKNWDEQQDILTTNYYNHNNGFSDEEDDF